jgi:predicted transcriptional regulator
MVRISVEVTEDVAQELGRIAARGESTAEAVLSRWVAEAVTERRELRERLDAAMADLEAGRTVAHEDVMAELDAWATDLEARHQAAR